MLAIFEAERVGSDGRRTAPEIEIEIFEPGGPVPAQHHLDAGAEDVAIGDQSGWPALQGPHNAQNAAIAIAVAKALGIDAEMLERGLATYPGLPHRMERVREVGGILYVNDSKATNAEAASKAMMSYDNIYWIAGGKAKAGGIESLAAKIKNAIVMYRPLLRLEGV